MLCYSSVNNRKGWLAVTLHNLFYCVFDKWPIRAWVLWDSTEDILWTPNEESANTPAHSEQDVIVVPSTVSDYESSESAEVGSEQIPDEEFFVEGEATYGEEPIVVDEKTPGDEIVVIEDNIDVESEPPTSPGEVPSIEYSGYDLDLFWTRSTDDSWAMGYDIYRNGVLLAPMLDALSFYDDTVQPDTEYTYEVIAVDDHGYSSEPASLLLTTPADLPAGTLPSNYAVLRGGDSASWEISDGLGTSNGMPSSGSCIFDNGAGSGVGITEAWLPDQGDAFDLASLIWVNGEQLGGYLRSATDSTTNYSTFPITDLVISTEFHAVSQSV